jgi:hypothetical protein
MKHASKKDAAMRTLTSSTPSAFEDRCKMKKSRNREFFSVIKMKHEFKNYKHDKFNK